MLQINANTNKLRKFLQDFSDFKGMKEESRGQDFWRTFIKDVLQQEPNIEWEYPVEGIGSIDVYIPLTKVIIEQKGPHKKLDIRYTQSSGDELTPFEQAKRYNDNLGTNKKANWIVTSNFREIWIYDIRDDAHPEPIKLELHELETQYPMLYFLVDPDFDKLIPQTDITTEAAKMMKAFYDELAGKYMGDAQMLENINILCTRLVFCLYCEDTEVFGQRNMFFDYLHENSHRTVLAIKELFDFFNLNDQQREESDPDYKLNNPRLAQFPYVNGDLFKRKITIPPLIGKTRDTLGELAGLDWSKINPTIFGSMFESTLNPETRHEGGMHYTSVQNIHKVIDPLFLNDLTHEFNTIRGITVVIDQQAKLLEFQHKIASLRFLDPACGSGNFLTESYLSLRRLENQILKLLPDDKRQVRVSFSQFYGIEIHDFAVSVARVALWIAEHQMLEETKAIIGHDLPFFPLKNNPNIIEANALRIDWKDVVESVDYVMGNPPYFGSSLQSREQKDDIMSVCVDEKGKSYNMAGKFDYVTGWFFKASEYIQGTNTKCAFVSTNSITQGEQVAGVWKPLFERFGIHIDFAYKTFKWKSESADMAAVHVIIVGFSSCDEGRKYIFDDDKKIEAQNINAYLIDAPNLFISPRTKAVCDVPEICKGFQTTDFGNLTMNQEERDELVKKEPKAERWIRPFSQGDEFINAIPRYCLWLADAKSNDIASMPQVKKRVAQCREARMNAPVQGDAYKLRDIPHLFRPCKQFKDEPYIGVPLTSSENREYIPMDYVNDGRIPGNGLFAIFNATLYHFSILTSSVHMAWMRAVCGRLEMRYRYSKDIVYNNFPWPEVNEQQKEKIALCGQKILDARQEEPDASLATLYDDAMMPTNLRKAHRENDQAVMKVYGFAENMTEAEIVANLMKRYQALAEK